MKNTLYGALGIIALGIFLRLYRFTTIPFGLNHDASMNGLVAIDLWQKLPSYTPYYVGWVGETFYHYYLIVNFLIFGINPTTIRIAALIMGLAALPIFYILAKKLQTKNVALFSTFFFAISGWHITMSKVGWLAIMMPVFQSLTFIFLLKAFSSSKKLYWILPGAFMALTLNTYAAARVTPLIVLAFLLFHYFTSKKTQRPSFHNLVFFVLSFGIVIAPLVNFALHDWHTYTARANHLLVTNRIQETGSLEPLLDDVTTTLGMLHVRANGDDFFVNEPLLETIPGILFVIGFLALLTKLNTPFSFLILTWSLAGLIPGILGTPNGNHNFSIMVPMYLIVGLGAHLLFRFLQKVKLQKSVVIAFMIVLSLTALYDLYSKYYSSTRREVFGFYPEATIVARVMKEQEKKYDFYVTDNYPRDILTFTMYKQGNPFEQHYTWFEQGDQFLGVEKNDKGLMFFMFANEENEHIANQLLTKFPGSYRSHLWYTDDAFSRKVSLVVTVPQ